MSRRVFISFLALILLAAIVPAPAVAVRVAVGAGSIQGQVVNGTQDGGSVGGVTVSLLPFRGGEPGDPLSTNAEASGTFRFDGLETGSDWAYLVRVSHEGVTYSQGPIAFEGGQTLADAQVLVYEATDDSGSIAVERAHLLLAFTDAGLQLTEVYVFANSGDRTYVGQEEIDGRRVVASIQLPRGARNLGFDDGSLGRRFISTKDGFADTEPQWPGQTSIVFSYELECPYRECTLVRVMPGPTMNLNVLLPSLGTRLETDRLSFGGELDAQGQAYLNYTGLNLASGEEVVLRLVPMSGAASSSTKVASQSLLPVAAIVVVGIAGLIALAYPLLRRRAGSASGSDSSE